MSDVRIPPVRLSVDFTSTYYDPEYIYDAVVVLNGQRQEQVIEYDASSGWVDVFDLANGKRREHGAVTASLRTGCGSMLVHVAEDETEEEEDEEEEADDELMEEAKEIVTSQQAEKEAVKSQAKDDYLAGIIRDAMQKNMEAILPLQRGPDGNLGVASGGAASGTLYANGGFVGGGSGNGAWTSTSTAMLNYDFGPGVGVQTVMIRRITPSSST